MTGEIREDAAAAAAKSLQSCPTLCDPIDGSPPGSPTRLPCPWDSPGKNTGVGCHFLLQCMKVKVKSLSRVRLLVTPWTAALPGSSVHGIFQARVLEWGAIAFSRREDEPYAKLLPKIVVFEVCQQILFDKNHSRAGFLNLSTTDILGQNILCHGGGGGGGAVLCTAGCLVTSLFSN